MKREPNPLDIKVGARIQKLRADLGISGLDLAKALGVTRGAVGNWERGQGIKRENLQRIADIYRISFEWLATGRGDPANVPQAPQTSIDRMLEEMPPELADEAAELREDFARQILRLRKIADTAKTEH